MLNWLYSSYTYSTRSIYYGGGKKRSNVYKLQINTDGKFAYSLWSHLPPPHLLCLPILCWGGGRGKRFWSLQILAGGGWIPTKYVKERLKNKLVLWVFLAWCAAFPFYACFVQYTVLYVLYEYVLYCIFFVPDNQNYVFHSAIIVQLVQYNYI